MREVSTETTAAWMAPEKIGDQAVVLRATVEKAHMRLTPYSTANAPGNNYGQDRDRRGNFGTFLFTSTDDDPTIREIRGIMSYSHSTNVDQDVDEATLVIFNSEVTPIGDATEDTADYDDPGHFTFTRGNEMISADRWGNLSNGWDNYLAPDRLVKVYAGYGSDGTVAPAVDPNLSIRGTWMIDSVEISSSEGTITLKMRSLARLLLDQICFPPVIPWEDYPVTWQQIHNEDVPGREPIGGSWVTPGGAVASSNEAYVINASDPDAWEPALEDTPRYVGRFGQVQGHGDGDPLSGDPDEYWLSTGQDSRKSFVWWQSDLSTDRDVSAIKLRTFSGPYRVYVSVHDNTGDWAGKRKIPYTPTTGDIDNGSKIKFVHTEVVNKGEVTEIVLPRVYHNVNRIRLTFTRLRDFDGNYPWRAGLRSFQIYTGSDLSFDETGTITKAVGNYVDWTDVVKWACAWAGFWFPAAHSHNIIQWTNDPADDVHYDYDSPDTVLPKGRVWGNLQATGTGGVAAATPDNFDKQPLMDIITYVRNIVGFFFRVDEVGQVMWRMPNIYAKGCYVTPHHLTVDRRPHYVDEHITIDENNVLVDYSTTASSANLRERIFVANSTGKFGTVIRGYQPYKVGLRRVAGWTDEHFSSNRECRVAADMIAAQQMFDWRRGSVTMPAHPGLQIDDQVRIFERVTNETFYHYVLGIEETYDATAGTWMQTLTTHWLGENISDAWVVRVNQLDAATQNYLSHLGTVE